MFLFEQSLLAPPVNKGKQNVNITAEFPVTEGFENCRPPPAQVGVLVPVLPLPVRPLQHPAPEPQRGPAPAVAHAGPRAGGDPHPQETLHQPLGELAHRQVLAAQGSASSQPWAPRAPGVPPCCRDGAAGGRRGGSAGQGAVQERAQDPQEEDEQAQVQEAAQEEEVHPQEGKGGAQEEAADEIWERFGAHLEESWLEKCSCRLANPQDLPEELQAIKKNLACHKF